MIKITECPRDAMQGIEKFIPTSLKVKYINALLKVGFDVIDFGSFVSPKAIPQLKDTAEVLSRLDLSKSQTKLLAIVANERGAHEAGDFDQIDILGFPFSVSEQFQINNTNKTREQSLETVKKMLRICEKSKKKLRVYLSMGFGNPYGEEYSPEIVLDWGAKLADLGVAELALSDTIGVSQPSNIKPLFELMHKELKTTEISAHFHTCPHSWEAKILAASRAGCKSFDSTIKGIGGCPMTEDELVGNLATEKLLSFLEYEVNQSFDKTAFEEAMLLSKEVFG